jgi:nickel-type superoxide dismutase maturation protease
MSGGLILAFAFSLFSTKTISMIFNSTKALLLMLIWLMIYLTLIFARPALLGIEVFRIEGNSMLPTLRPNEYVLVNTNAPVETNDIVVVLFGEEQKALVKRLALMLDAYGNDDNYIWVLGDNPQESTDSREFGRLPLNNLVGRVMWVW